MYTKKTAKTHYFAEDWRPEIQKGWDDKVGRKSSNACWNMIIMMETIHDSSFTLGERSLVEWIVAAPCVSSVKMGLGLGKSAIMSLEKVDVGVGKSRRLSRWNRHSRVYLRKVAVDVEKVTLIWEKPLWKVVWEKLPLSLQISLGKVSVGMRKDVWTNTRSSR